MPSTLDWKSQSRNRHLTFAANTTAGRHGWLRLTPAYGVRLVRERIARLPRGAVVTDPFCGTGTTALAAAESGRTGQSVDLNPFLIWLARAKTRHYPAELLAEATEQVREVGAVARAAGGELWQPNLFKIGRWWDLRTLRALQAIRHAIDQRCEPGGGTDLLELALCRTLISHSNAAFNHQSMSFTSAADDGTALDAERVFDTFAAEARTLIGEAAGDLPGNALIVPGDSRTGARELAPCDLLLTSPPYVNRMSYIRELRPYMYWLRFLDRSSDAGELDWQAIGGTWGTATSKLNGWEPESRTPVEAELDRVCRAISVDGGKNGPLLANYVRKYFHDMWAHFQAAMPLVKPGGAVSYIVGNSTFYGHVVPVQLWYAELLRQAGCERVEIEVIRKRNSNKALYEYEVRGVRPA